MSSPEKIAERRRQAVERSRIECDRCREQYDKAIRVHVCPYCHGYSCRANGCLNGEVGQ